MKRIVLVFLLIITILNVQAQLSKTVVLTTAGSLSAQLSVEERIALTNLTVSGYIDSRDFRFMRDSLPKLSYVDLSESTIKAYIGNAGTYYQNAEYEEDAIPGTAFNTVNSNATQNSTLTEILLPKATRTIDSYAFYKCVSLKKVQIPNSVTRIRGFAFYDNLSLTELQLPKSLKIIDINAFISVPINTLYLPDSLESIGDQAFSYCTNLQVVNIPNAVKSLGNGAFRQCAALLELKIGSSVQHFGYGVFGNCTSLKSIHVFSDVPQVLGTSNFVFSGVNAKTCVLNVPMGMKSIYSIADQWSAFSSIVEDSVGFYPVQRAFRMAAEAGSSASVRIISTVPWTCSSDQSWLKILRTGRIGFDTLSFTAEANVLKEPRTALVQLSSEGRESKYMTIQQAASPKILQVTAGGLLSGLTAVERGSITNLVLTGTIDSRDFKIVRDSLPQLSRLDLSAVTILAYTGALGTSTVNKANTIPDDAFYNQNYPYENTKLETIILPVSATGIGSNAFFFCTGLSNVVFQLNMKFIDWDAFGYCSSLTSIEMPQSVNTIDNRAFEHCIGLKTVVLNDSLKTLGTYVFNNCILLDSVRLGNTLTKLNNYTFGNCTNLSSIQLPESITFIGEGVFRYCTGLKNLYVKWIDPLTVSQDYSPFNKVDTSTCVLHIPWGSKAVYGATKPWSSFQTMKESASGFRLNVHEIALPNVEGSNTTLKITSNTMWEVRSDQNWLKVGSISGSGDSTIVLFSEFNPLYETRKARITIESPGQKSQFVDVIQSSSIKYVTINAGGLLTALTARERASLDQLTILGTIDARDFKTMRDSLFNLTNLDLSQTKILAYTGVGGTASSSSFEWYEANHVPCYAFKNNYDYHSNKLKSIVLPNSITAIDYNSFEDCALLDSIRIPNSVTKLGNDAFMGCLKMTKLTLSNSITILPNYAFYYCQSLTEVILPDSLTTIEGYAFSQCIVLTSLKFGKKLVTIGESAFSSCYKLNEVNIPGTVKTINSYAFSDDRFQTLILPPSVNFIGANAFVSSNLITVYVFTKTPLLLTAGSIFDGLDYSKCTLYVPKGSKSTYQSTNYWSQFINISEGKSLSFSDQSITLTSGSQKTVELTSSQSWTLTCNQPWLTFSETSGTGDAWLTISAEKNPYFSLRSALVTLVSSDSTIPELVVPVIEYGAAKTVTVTPNGLFGSLKKGEIQSVTNLVINGEMDARDFKFLRDSMPQLVLIDMSSVTIKSYFGFDGTIGYSYYLANAIPPESFFIANTGRSNPTLTLIRLPESCVAIGSTAFKNAVGLTSVSIPNKVTSIGAEAFYGCIGLDSLYLGTSLTTIAQGAFYRCAMKNLVLPNSLQIIEAEAFMESLRLTNLQIPNSVLYLGTLAFYTCPSLREVTLPNGLKVLDKSVFGLCRKLTKIMLPESLTSIGANAFSFCTSLTSITIPSQVTKIDVAAFQGCTNLSSIYAFPIKPVDLSAAIYDQVFASVDKIGCMLYVPSGSKSLYASSLEWKDFTNIIEQNVSVDLEQSSILAISPNPVRKDFIISGLNGVAEVILTDLSGKVWLSTSVVGGESVRADAWPTGVYMLRIKTSEGIVVRKLVKAK
jgi:hypothetical protein